MTINNPLIDTIRDLSAPMAPVPTGVEPVWHDMPGVKAVILDIYGTLVTSGTGDISLAREMSSGDALAESLADTGFSGVLDTAGRRGTDRLTDVISEYHAAARERGIAYPEVDIRAVWEEVCRRLTDDGLLEPHNALIQAIPDLAVRYECRVNPVWPMPDAVDVLERLRQRVRLGIVSNAQFYTPLLFPALLERTLDDLGFEAGLRVFSYEQGCAKPSERLFPPLLKHLAADGIEPGQVAYVGNDMLNDVWTAHQAGCRTVLFAGDKRSLRWREDDERCRGLQPDAVVTQLRDLPEITS